MVRQRVRLRFTKQGDLRWIGHRDLARLMERLFRRAGLRLGMSQGYHPKPRMSFPSALALGMEGLDEVIELELAEPWTAAALMDRLGAHAIAGLTFRSAESLPPGASKARVRSVTYEVPLAGQPIPAVARRAAELMATPSLPVRRARGGAEVDLRHSLEALEVHGSTLRMRLAASRRAAAGPREVLIALGLQQLLETGAVIVRTRVELEP
ncbi:MAG TPA: DUF2344 domain-containing protein [Planctomycetes bacterium]|nr:DUF2344 domain-containing protein [Planctomycetota bacterium]